MALGYTVTNEGNRITGHINGASTIVFRLQGETFAATGATANLSTIGKKYAEIGVRNYARRKGYSVQMEGAKITLTARRY